MTLTQELPRVGEKGRRVEGGASKGTGTAGMGRPNWGWLRSRGADKVEEVAVVQESRGPEEGSTRVHAGWGEVLCVLSIRLTACLVFPCRMRWLQPTGISTVGPACWHPMHQKMLVLTPPFTPPYCS